MREDLINKTRETVYPIEKWVTWHKAKEIDIASYIEDDTMVFNFQGSVTKEDWKGNFAFFWKPYKRMSKTFFLHYGFIKRYHLVRDEIHRRFIKSGVQKVKIRGYSHGAALATICYADFMWHKEHREEYKNIHIDGFTMASPRITSVIGGSEFNRLCRGLINLQNHNDTVTRVPFTWMLYRHVGEIERIGKRRIWPFTTRSIAQHWYESYLGYLKDKDYIDTEENNKYYTTAKKYSIALNTGVLLLFAFIVLLLL